MRDVPVGRRHLRIPEQVAIQATDGGQRSQLSEHLNGRASQRLPWLGRQQVSTGVETHG